MSGKRVLDAVALLSATRSIAIKHFDIRLSQVDVYTKTSSIFKAAQSRAPPPLAAAAQSFSQSVSKAAKIGEHIPNNVPEADAVSSASREGVKQDHFYKKSDHNATIDPVPEEDLEVTQKQASRQPLPDGSIPPTDSIIRAGSEDAETFYNRPTAEAGQQPTQGSGEHLDIASSGQSTIPEPAIQKPLSPDAARKAQRQSESQIPTNTADPPNPEDDGSPEFSVDQEQDVFYQPPDSTSPVLSALPRMRVPKIENDVQAGDSHIPQGLNADVYYSGNKDDETKNTEDEPSEEQLDQIFHNPRIARLLGNKGKYVPDGVARKSFHTSTVSSQRSTEAEKEDIRQLASDMAKDVQDNKVSSQLRPLLRSKLIKLTAHT